MPFECVLGAGESSPDTTIQKFVHSSPFPTKFLFPPHQKSIQSNKKLKCHFLAAVIAPGAFFLISYSFETQFMLILTLIDIQYSENAGFSFKNFSNNQNHSFSGSHEKIPPAVLTTIWHKVREIPKLLGEKER